MDSTHQVMVAAGRTGSIDKRDAQGETSRVNQGLWALHWVVRMLAAILLLPYAVAKVGLSQMGLLDYSQLLITLGEKSPMGLVWTFIAFSPAIQVLAGLVELTAVILVVWRKTAWLGGLIGVGALSVVFILNLAYDIPVKGGALMQLGLYLLVLAPWLPSLWRCCRGRESNRWRVPMAVNNPKVHRFTRLFPVIVTAFIVAGSLAIAAFAVGIIRQENSGPVVGVFRVVEDSTPPAEQLVDDRRWAVVAFDARQIPTMGESLGGDEESTRRASLSLRRANGQLYSGFYEVQGDTLRVELTKPLAVGDKKASAFAQDMAEQFTFSWELEREDKPGVKQHMQTLRLEREGQTMELVSSRNDTLLLDRGFRWGGEAVLR